MLVIVDVGRHINGFDDVNEVYAVYQENSKGRMLLELCLEKELCVK